MKKLNKVASCLLLLALSFCSAQKEQELTFTAKPSFVLVNGNPLSLPTADELSPQLVQHPDGKLTLVFISNRSCNNGANCSANNYHVFLSRTLVAYQGGSLPPFTEPINVKDGINNPISQQMPFLIAAKALGNDQILIYEPFDNSHLHTHTVNVNTGSIAATNSLTLGNYQFLGFDPYQDKIFAKNNANTLMFHSTPQSFSNSPTPIPFYQGFTSPILNVVGLPEDLAPQGKNAFFYLAHGSVGLGSNGAVSGLPHTPLSLASTRYLMEIKQIAVLKSNVAGNEVFILAAKSQRNNDQTFDLYLVKPYNARELWHMALKEAAGFTWSEPPEGPPPSGLRAFITNNTFQGNLGGVAGADNKCNSDPAKPSSGNFRALVVTNYRQIGDILQPNTSYYHYNYINQQTSLTPWFSTDNFGKIYQVHQNVGGSVFWTGLEGNQSPASYYNCSDWNDSSSSSNGRYGNSSYADVAPFVSSDYGPCNQSYPLLCIEGGE